MTATTYTPAAPFGAITIYRAVSALSGVVEAVNAWRLERKTRRILASLGDDVLEDIGLTRADI